MNGVRAIMAAADTAARWHAAQRRKGEAQEPYVNHLLEVAALIAEATEGRDPDLVIAGLLHDAVEDSGISADEIAARFGADVAALVMAVTDDKSLPKAERKRLQIVMAPKKDVRAKILKIADKTSNLRALAASPPAGWPAARRRDYIAWARAVVDGARGVSPWLEGQFDQAAAAADAALAG